MDFKFLDSPIGQIAFAFMAVILLMTVVSVFKSDTGSTTFGVIFTFVAGIAGIGIAVMHLSPL
jgi:hypothetical protein